MDSFTFPNLVQLMAAVKFMNEIGVDYELQAEELTIVCDELSQSEYDQLRILT